MWVLPVRFYQHLFVISLDGKEPRLAQQLETVQDAWVSVDQITHGNHKINRAVEAKRF